MRRFDQRIKKLAAADRPTVPREAAEEWEQIMDSLPEREANTGKRHFPMRSLMAAAAAVVVLFVLLPNISPNLAYAMEQIPVIGEIVKVVTIREYQMENKNYQMDVKVPEIAEVGAAAEEEINNSVRKLTDRVIEQFYEDTDEMQGNGHQSLHIDYVVLSNNSEWFTLKFTITETAASSNVYHRFYHIDKKNGEIVNFSDLFQPDTDYRTAICDELRRQMQEQMEENPDICYWQGGIDVGTDIVSVADDQNFYWNEAGELVIVFDEGEVGPSYMGCPEFAIPKTVYEQYLR